MTPIEYLRDNQRWQDSLKPGDEVFIDHSKGGSSTSWLTQVRTVNEHTIVTLDGESFSRETRMSTDLLPAEECKEIVPADNDFQLVLPPLSQLVSEGFSTEEAQDILTSLEECYNQRKEQLP